jgi:hypothetical protein
MCVQKSQKLLLYHSTKMGLFQPVFRGGNISAIASVTHVYDGLEIGAADAPRSYFPRVRPCGIFRPEQKFFTLGRIQVGLKFNLGESLRQRSRIRTCISRRFTSFVAPHLSLPGIA